MTQNQNNYDKEIKEICKQHNLEDKVCKAFIDLICYGKFEIKIEEVKHD